MSLALCPLHAAGSECDTIVYGRVYAERQHDLSFENDHVGFRIYSADKRRAGERLYGHDLWLKRGGSSLVVPTFYAIDSDRRYWDIYHRMCREQGKAAAQAYRNEHYSFHYDHGRGCDPYAVGPTLGAGAAALLVRDTLRYHWGYDECEIVENGPRRFVVRLTYNSPYRQHTTLTLDAGTRLCRADITYDDPAADTIAIGIALHGKERPIVSPDRRYIAFADPTQTAEYGPLFLGIVVPTGFKEAREIDGNIVALIPGRTATYYFGFAWSHEDIKTMDEWVEHLSSMSN